MFIVLEGAGTLRVAGENAADPDRGRYFYSTWAGYPHQIINTSAAPLKYLSIGTPETAEVVEYPDSGKICGPGNQAGRLATACCSTGAEQRRLLGWGTLISDCKEM